MPLVLCVCENCFQTFTTEHKLRVLENRMLRVLENMVLRMLENRVLRKVRGKGEKVTGAGKNYVMRSFVLCRPTRH